MTDLPPLLKYYFEIQNEYPESIICIEIGAFYEIMELNGLGYARKASELADIVLTKKNKKKEDSPLMAGFPNHTAENYFKKLIDAGQSVVVVSQEMRGKRSDNNKKINRYVEKILSPGTVVENLDATNNNFYASVYMDSEFAGLSLVDISTGDVRLTEGKLEDILIQLEKVEPVELISNEELNLKFSCKQHLIKKEIKKINDAGAILENYYSLENISGNYSDAISTLGLTHYRMSVLSFSNLINFLSDTDYHKRLLKKLSKPELIDDRNKMLVPKTTIRSLELLSDEGSSLFKSMNKCKTSMGSRLLKEWIHYPLTDLNKINERLDKVSSYIKGISYKDDLIEIYDIPRITRKLILKTMLPHEMGHLEDSILSAVSILKKEKSSLTDIGETILKDLETNIDSYEASQINKEFEFLKGPLLHKVKEQKEDMNFAKKEINEYIKTLENKIISELDGVSRVSLRWEKKTEKVSLILSTSIGKQLDSRKGILKTRKRASSYEVVEDEWKRISENYYLKHQKFVNKAQEIFEEYQKDLIDKYHDEFLDISRVIAQIDVLQNFSEIARDRDYNRVSLIDSEKLSFKFNKMRHVMVDESSLKEPFVPFDINTDNYNIMTLYGANSSGKSTLLKSTALVFLLTQIGSYAPVSSGELTPAEGIITRMSSEDSLTDGYSTFTLEMKELKEALSFRSTKTLFLLDEIGRGTSVEDGEALAFATLDYLSTDEFHGIAFFATHYHNLSDKVQSYENITVNHIASELINGSIKFSRELTPGPGDGSYGIDVAKSCSIPDELIRVARNYNRKFAKLTKSRYNTNVKGFLCIKCNSNPIQETHHKQEQLQGRQTEINIKGIRRGINYKDNLELLCSSCHHDITYKK
jgi:DNA mismatch repair protein MutS